MSYPPQQTEAETRGSPSPRRWSWQSGGGGCRDYWGAASPWGPRTPTPPHLKTWRHACYFYCVLSNSLNLNCIINHWQSKRPHIRQGQWIHSLSSSVLSSKAGLSRPASSVHMGPLPLVLLGPAGGEGVRSLRSVCGERGDLGGLVTIARSSPLSHRGPSTLVCWHRVPGHLSPSNRRQFVSPSDV